MANTSKLTKDERKKAKRAARKKRKAVKPLKPRDYPRGSKKPALLLRICQYNRADDTAVFVSQ